MATVVAKAYHPGNGSTVEVWEGYSWSCLLIAPIWFAYREMWGWAILSLAAFFAFPVLSNIVFGAMANGAYANYLLKEGYLNEEQWLASRAPPKAVAAPTHRPAESVADQLTKLAKLRQQGLLTDAEFAREKTRLLR